MMPKHSVGLHTVRRPRNRPRPFARRALLFLLAFLVPLAFALKAWLGASLGTNSRYDQTVLLLLPPPPGFARTTSGGISFLQADTRQLAKDAVPDNDAHTAGSDAPGTVLFAVTSSPDEATVRNAIRSTWAKEIPHDSRLKFFVGQPKLPDQVLSLRAEMLHNGDMVFLENILDTYTNLTLKTLAVFAWAQEYAREKYIMKLDTDVYVKITNLKTLLATLPLQKVYTGNLVGFNTDNIPLRVMDKNWVLEKWLIHPVDYPSPFYPPYYFGFAYLVSKDMAAPIAQCLPRDLSCTAPDTTPAPWWTLWSGALHNVIRKTRRMSADSGLGGSYATCDIPQTCLFRPLRFEDVAIGGILFNYLTNSAVNVDCPTDEGMQQCVDQVQDIVAPLTRDAPRFVNFPWRKKANGERRCDDDFIAMHRVSESEMETYYAGGEGEQTSMCSLYFKNFKRK